MNRLIAVCATLFLLQAGPVPAQERPVPGDPADRADDFLPDVPAQPIGELVDDFLSGNVEQEPASLAEPTQATDDFATASEEVSPPQEAPVAATSDPAGAVVVPAGWKSYSRSGVTFHAPPDWQVLKDDDDRLLVGKQGADNRSGIAIGVDIVRAREFDKLPPDAAVTDLPQRLFADAGAFRQRGFEADMKGVKTMARLMMSVLPVRTDRHLIVYATAGGAGIDRDPDLFDKLFAAVTVAPSAFETGNTTASETSGEGLGGLVSFRLSENWSVLSDRPEFLSIQARPGYPGYLTLETGEYARQTLEREMEFDSEPAVSQTEILGESARLHEGMTKGAEVYRGASVVKGHRRVFVFDRCLEGTPLVMTLVGEPDWEAKAGFGPLLDTLRLNLPAEALPCDPATATASAAGNGQPSAQARPALVRFSETGTQGWRGENADLSNPGRATPDGEPYLAAYTPGDGRVGYYVAPPDLLGDWSNVGGLRLLISTSPGQYVGAYDYDGSGDVVISNGSMSASIEFDHEVGSGWGEQSVVFSDTSSWRLSGGAGSLADILGRVTDFRIRAEYRVGDSYSGLKQVEFVPAAAPLQTASDPASVLVPPTQTQSQTHNPVQVPPPAQPVSGTLYDVGGVRFTLPADWRISSDRPEDKMFQSPDGRFTLLAFWWLPDEPLLGSDDIVAVEYPVIDHEPATRIVSKIAGRSVIQSVSERARADGKRFIFTLEGEGLEPNAVQTVLEPIVRTLELHRAFTPGAAGGTEPQAVVPQPVATPVPPQPATQPMRVSASDWQTYVNGRYGTAIEFPADLFLPEPPPANDDGRSFRTLDGTAGFYVFSQYNVFDLDASGLMARDKQAAAGADFTYERVTENWYVLSGYRGNAIFYRKVLVAPDGLLRVFEITYPASAAEAFDPVLARMAKSLTAVVEPEPQGVTLGKLYTPKKGNPERSAIMDAARQPVTGELGQRVIFVVSVLRTDGHLAYLQARPVQPNGKPINWLKTPFARDRQADAMSDTIMVLLEKRSGAWQVKDYVIGPTDVHWYVWIDQYGVPEKLFH